VHSDRYSKHELRWGATCVECGHLHLRFTYQLMQCNNWVLGVEGLVVSAIARIVEHVGIEWFCDHDDQSERFSHQIISPTLLLSRLCFLLSVSAQAVASLRTGMTCTGHFGGGRLLRILCDFDQHKGSKQYCDL
jgi:hypothetical protein